MRGACDSDLSMILIVISSHQCKVTFGLLDLVLIWTPTGASIFAEPLMWNRNNILSVLFQWQSCNWSSSRIRMQSGFPYQIWNKFCFLFYVLGETAHVGPCPPSDCSLYWTTKFETKYFFMFLLFVAQINGAQFNRHTAVFLHSPGQLQNLKQENIHVGSLVALLVPMQEQLCKHIYTRSCHCLEPLTK